MRLRLLFVAIPVLAQAPEPPAHQKLIPTLWVQTSVEWRAACRQTFLAAQRTLDAALADPAWTAAPEQSGAGPARLRELPPAVIVDVDETVLDNSPGQARQVKAGSGFDLKMWTQWVSESQAEPLPGALGFARVASARGITIFYVTNRDAQHEAATRANLMKHGFPLPAVTDVVLCRGEKPEWSSDKSTRRAFVASTHRILLLVGDDLGDFLSGVRTGSEKRRMLAAPYEEYWGRKWFMLPNPGYGSWEEALYGEGGAKDPAEQLKKKLEALKSAER
jgi:5'-nucleotidase (lipoprotein e(P4) family)